jgi:hypothetical protein
MLLMIAGTLKFLISYIFGHQGTVFGLWNACTLFLTCSTIISGQLGNMKVPRVHENPQKSDASIFSIVLTLGYMKIHKKRTLHFSPIFMTPGTWKTTKIRDFNFHVHENQQKSDDLIFFNFHDPGYMKIHKIQTIWFSSIFMTPGTLNPKKSNTAIFFNFHDPGYMKIYKFRQFDFLQFSWSRVQENPQKSDASTFMYMKINKNQTLWFSSIFMIPGTWKFTKIRSFDFLQFLWLRVLNPQKSDTAIFFNFHDPGYMKIHKIQTIWFSSIFMKIHENSQKSNTSIFFNFHDPGYMKIHKNQRLQLSCEWKFTKIRSFDFLQFS